MHETLNLAELKSLDFDKIERLQNARFRATVRHLLPRTKFYAELFREYHVDPFRLETVEDWQTAGLPLVKKFYYMKHVEDFIVKPENPFKTHANYLSELDKGEMIDLYFSLLHKQALYTKLFMYYNPKMPLFSGGTQSGKPTPTLITATQMQKANQIMSIAAQMMSTEFLEDMETVGMNLFPYGPHLAWHAVNMAFNIGVNMNLGTAAGGAMRTKDLVVMADRFKANVFAGMAEYIANRFLPMAVKKKIKLGEKALFINGSEKMSLKDKTKIKKLAKKLGITDSAVLDFYGASELKEDIMPECTPGSGFHHISPLSNIIKTVKINKMTKQDRHITDWEFIAPERGGAAVVWAIGGAGTVLNGYLLGDNYSRIIKEKCPRCGLNVERIYGISRLKLR